MIRCQRCPVPLDVPCFAAAHGLTDWCGNLSRWRQIILGRSLGKIEDASVAADVDLAKIRDCCHADRPWEGCACVDRYCGREQKIMSGRDCLDCGGVA
jgi:hypothetical protein